MITRIRLHRQGNKLRRTESGQAVTEFALVAPVVILIMLAIVSFGLVFSWQSILNNAAREGARAGAVNKSDSEIMQIVTANTTLLPRASTVRVSIKTFDPSGEPLDNNQRQRGGSITVSCSYTASVVGIPGILSSEKALEGRSTFRMESD
jgi:Flp pilus assembly protein TadG